MIQPGPIVFDSISTLRNYSSSPLSVGLSVRTLREDAIFIVRQVGDSGRFLVTAGGDRLERIIASNSGWQAAHRIEKEPLINNVRIVASRLRDGFVYGNDGIVLYRSSDGAKSWEVLSQAFGKVDLLVPAGDGEVLAACDSNGVVKSTGWPTPTRWTTVLSVPGSAVLSWGLDSDGTGFCVATQYRATDYAQSRFVWKSENAGDQWVVIRDINEVCAGEVAPEQHHIHFATIDPWADRVWISWHPHLSNGGTLQRVEYSDDRGVTWNTLTTDVHPTTCVATPLGMVMGSDDGPGGVFHVPRTENPQDMKLYLAAPLGVERAFTAHCFSVYSEYDEADGVCYVGFISQIDGYPGAAFASDGLRCSELYRTPPQKNGNGLRELAISGGDVLWRATLDDGNFILRMNKAVPGPSSAAAWDTGRVIGGRIDGDTYGSLLRSTAIGAQSVAGPGSQCLAVGVHTQATHSGSVVFRGDKSRNNNEFRLPPNVHLHIPFRSGTPGAADDGVVLWAYDNGGKIELRCRFPNGEVKVLSEETT